MLCVDAYLVENCDASTDVHIISLDYKIIIISCIKGRFTNVAFAIIAVVFAIAVALMNILSQEVDSASICDELNTYT